MSYPGKGKADYLELGDWNAACAECGRKFKASTMRKLPVGVPGGSMWVCPEHWNPRQPQDFVRGIPEKMAAPWSQQQNDDYVYTTYNYDEDQDDAIELTFVSGESSIITVMAGVTVSSLSLINTGGAVVQLNIFGIIEELYTNEFEGTLTINIFPGSAVLEHYTGESGLVGVGVVGEMIVGGDPFS